MRTAGWLSVNDVQLPLNAAIPALPAHQQDAHSQRLLQNSGMPDTRFAEGDIAGARRAYYGSISHVDQMVGRILDTLRATGAAGNTAIILTSDHGEMLGGRGMWSTTHVFEPSLRLPLIRQALWIAPQRVAELASLVDLLSNFMGLPEGIGWANSSAGPARSNRSNGSTGSPCSARGRPHRNAASMPSIWPRRRLPRSSCSGRAP
ncbi:sulfatase-like hydrolase/transferase [Mesobaculum littorinae]|uniref:sulfatase-like hydrolase/transferase n=1 Tax=Mesobaculum littorinae TaxID=2486419 RepID=UPI0013E307A0|nr:sulfatase-like hydrolase/transferase [Mesobaculum littorinae]